MPSFISEQIIEQISSKIDIMEVVSKYIPLKRAGRNFKALCPFHHEKTPSFIVSPQKQIFHCFGCGSGGNVFNFIMKYEKIEFPEAVKMLADKAGVSLPKIHLHRDTMELEELYMINSLACDFFHNNLLKTEEAIRAKNFLGERQIKEETIAKFKIGLAQNASDSLFMYLCRKGIKKQLAERLGLVCLGKEGNYYDRFRNKLMFPIANHRNRIVGFGARVLDDTLPKYINSPESQIYIKGNLLYGLNVAGEHIRRLNQVILVEGYMDVLMLFQSGIRNAVSTSGTSLTLEQIKLFKRLTNNVVIAFDPDEAGLLASLRGLEILLEFEADVSVAELPKGFDPDDFVRKFGAEKFIYLISQARDLFDFKLSFLLKKYDIKNLKDKLKVISEMLTTISAVKNAVLKTNLIKRLSERVLEDEEALLSELKRIKSAPMYQLENIQKRNVLTNARQAERIILGITLEDKSALSELRKNLVIDDFQEPNIKRIMAFLFEMDQGTDINVSNILCQFEEAKIRELICEVLIEADKLSDKRKNLLDCIKWVKQDNLKRTLKEIQYRIKLAQEIKDEDLVLGLVNKYNSLVKGQK